jgi:hypothetical protein
MNFVPPMTNTCTAKSYGAIGSRFLSDARWRAMATRSFTRSQQLNPEACGSRSCRRGLDDPAQDLLGLGAEWAELIE